MYIDKLDDIVNEYNNTYHRTIKMNPIVVKGNAYINIKKDVDDKDPKFKVGDHVRISNAGLSLCAAVTNLFSKLVITQFADQLKAKDTSQFINGISSVFQKLLKCFNGTAIPTFLCLLHFLLIHHLFLKCKK